jgi:phospholipid/cholesterol/gamma-HCH transport system substrate-binding protein
MQHESGIEYKVGLLMVGAAFLFAAFVFVLGHFSLSGGYTVYVDYDFSGNVQAGAPVKVSGITVGRVKDVEFKGGKFDEKEQRRVQVRVELWIEDRARDSIRSDAEFFINTAGVLGEQYVEIVPGKNWDAPPLAAGKVVVGVNPPRTDLIVSRLYDVLDSLSLVLRDDRDLIRDLLKNGASAVNEVNTLLVDNRKDLGALIGNANTLAGEAQQTLAKVNVGLSDPKMIDRTLRDADALLVSARGAIEEITPPAKTLINDATRVTGLLTEERVDRAIAVVDKAAGVAGKAGGLIDNVNGLVVDLRAGKGTAGALLVREELYADLREMLRDLKRNPWKFFWKE